MGRNFREFDSIWRNKFRNISENPHHHFFHKSMQSI